MSLLSKKAVFTNRTINTSNNLRNDVIDVDNINLFKSINQSINQKNI